MQRVEIKFRRKIVSAFVILIVLSTAGFLIYVLTAMEFANDTFLKVVQPIISIYVFYSMGKLGKKLRKNEAVILLSPKAITLNANNTAKFLTEEKFRMRASPMMKARSI